MLKKWIPIVLVTLLAVFLILLKFDPRVFQSFTHKNNNIAFSKPPNTVKQSSGKVKQHGDPSLPATFPFGRKANEDFAKKYPNKFAIVKKMYYSWDYIHNAQGSFSWGQPLQGGISKGHFYVDFDRKMNLANNKVIQNGKVVESENELYKNKLETLQFPSKKIYTILSSTIQSSHFGMHQALSFENSFITESEWFALIYNDYPDWSYKIGTKEGMPVYLITGVIKSTTSPDLAGPFTMVVSKDTGALLDLKFYGKKNKLIFFVSSKNLKINKGISNEQQVFKLNVSGDKKLAFPDFNSQTLGMQAVKGEKKGGVSQ